MPVRRHDGSSQKAARVGGGRPQTGWRPHRRWTARLPFDHVEATPSDPSVPGVRRHRTDRPRLREVPLSRAWDTAYADGGVPTWDIGRPQPAVVRLADEGAFGGPGASILDVGCGTGEHALLLAARGHPVVGVDLAAEAIRRARAKAANRAIAAASAGSDPGAVPMPRFEVHDALDLPSLGGAAGRPFDAALDVGLFHTLADEERPRYVAGLAAAIRPGGRAFVLCWSDRNPFGYGPRRISRREVRATFRASAGWRVDRIDGELLASRLPGGRVHAWLVRLSRRA